jgi:predicted homoserine dehydrogenase-like protein
MTSTILCSSALVGRPVRVGLIGAGKFGSMFLSLVHAGPLIIRDHAGE